MSENTKKGTGELTYKEKLNSTIDYLTEDKRSPFKKALKEHKFDSEVYIPQTMTINKAEYRKKNYLLNRLVKFNYDYYIKKQNLDKMQKENDKFTRQYTLVKNENEGVRNAYIHDIEEVYKLKGFNPKNVTYAKDENVFDPSLLLEEKEKYPMTCKIEDKIDIKRDIAYLDKFEKLIKEMKGKSKEEEEEELEKKNNNLAKSVTFNTDKRDSIFVDEYANAMENVKKKIMEELRIKNMSLRQLKQMNFNLMNEIKQTQDSLKNINNDEFYDNKKKKKYIVEDVFLSSKGMLRSAKKRSETKDNDNNKNILLQENQNINKENKKEENIINEIDKMDNNDNKIEEEKKFEEEKKKIKRKSLVTLTQREKKERFEKEKLNRLTRVYQNILKTNFKIEEKNVKNYIKAYTERTITEPNPKYGSNLHGFLNDFHRNITKTNVPNLTYEVIDAMRDINRINKNSFDSKYQNTQPIESMHNLEDLYELDEKINQLGYDYTEALLNRKDA
jgi:hypothetical protein